LNCVRTGISVVTSFSLILSGGAYPVSGLDQKVLPQLTEYDLMTFKT